MNFSFNFRSFHIKGMILIIILVITIILAFYYVSFYNTDSASSITTVEEPFLISIKGELNEELSDKIENQVTEDNYVFLEINSKTELNRIIKKYDLKEYGNHDFIPDIDKSYFKTNKIFAILMLGDGSYYPSNDKIVKIEQQKDSIYIEIAIAVSSDPTAFAEFKLICVSSEFVGDRNTLEISYRVNDILRPSHLYFREES